MKTQHDPLSIVLYGLTYHYIGGLSFFKDISYDFLLNELSEERPHGIAELSNIAKAEELIGSIDGHISIADIAKILEHAVENALNEANTNRVSHSITGGLDSRILLSILKKFDVEIHGYTYGNPQSIDCLIGKKIADELKIPYSVYNVAYDKVSFRKAAEDSIRLGNSLCSLHRTHRVNAIKNEAKHGDIMFLGTMGGEYVKGANRDDYIVSDFVYEYVEKPELDTIKKYMHARGLKHNDELAVQVKEVMDKQSYVIDKENMELHALLEIAAKLHHGQNLIQYSKYIPYVRTPFCDPEYMKVLFKSKYNFLYRRKKQSTLKYKKENPRFGTSMQNFLDKELGEMMYSYGFNAKEYLFSPYYAGFVAKLRKRKMKTPPTFPLDRWMEEFVKDTLREILNSSSSIKEYYDISLMLRELDQSSLPQTEQFWLKYTCPIQLYLTEQIYGVK